LVIPAVLVWTKNSIDIGWWRVLGAIIIALGLALFVSTVRYFARLGRGTLAPWDPTERLVVAGPYRYVRNPMITAVLTILLGEAALLRSLPILVWSGIFFALNAVYFPLAEEPELRRRFGAEYDEYCANVPRWIPRRRAWIPPPRDA